MVSGESNRDTVPLGTVSDRDTIPSATEPNTGADTPLLLPRRAGSGGSPLLRDDQILKGRHTYRIRSILGEGTFGCVLLAETWSEPGESEVPTGPRMVAIKAYRTGLPIDPVSLVKREVNALLSMKCDRVSQVLDFSLESNPPFLVMPYHGRGSLARTPLRPLEPEAAIRVLHDGLVALVHAHRASILHLDIKPGNILMDDAGGFVLGDFGIAHALRAAWSMVGPSLGTRGYQAPEQREFSERSIGTPTDLFGLGATVWALIAGRDPAVEEDLYTYFAAGDSGCAFPHLTGVSKACPPAVAELVMRMIAIDPGKRPGSAAEALSEVQALMVGGLGWRATHELRQSDERLPDANDSIADGLFDPFWRGVFASPVSRRLIRRIASGEILTREATIDPRAFILLRGEVEVSRSDSLMNVEEREGTIMGDVSALTGLPRTATLRARGEAWVAEFNAAQLEELAASHPAVAIRMIKTLAERLARESSKPASTAD